MLIMQPKPFSEVSALIKGRTIILVCAGCREVYFPQEEVDLLIFSLKESTQCGISSIRTDNIVARTVMAVIVTDYVCNVELLELQASGEMAAINDADTVLVFSCGVGVQTASGLFPNSTILAACDTIPLPGRQGVTPLEYGCAECGECHLNATGGICPITACSKSLLNGQCCGSVNGVCEVDREMECGWERIYARLRSLRQTELTKRPLKIRNYNILLDD